MAERAIELFFSYSHKDETLRDALASHLSSLEWEGVISSWHDRRIEPGTEWDGEIKTYLNTADIILLLISADFIASKYCRETEIKRAIERHETGEARVIPIILRFCDWTNTPFGKLQALPKNGEPVTSSTWGGQDAAFLNVVQGIRAAASSLKEARQQQIQQDQQAAVREVERQKIRDYRQEVEQLAREEDGDLSPLSRSILMALQNSLGLAAADITVIEQEVLQPYQVRKANRQEYEKVYRTALQHENPLTETTCNRLKRLQRALKLTDEEVAAIAQSTFTFDIITLNHQGTEQHRQPGSAKYFTEDLGQGVTLEMVAIPAGEFLMGTATAERRTIIQERTRHGASQKDAEKWTDWEMPQHRVQLPEFCMGKFAVTQAQWQQVTALPQVKIALNPDVANFKGAKRPVEQVSWEEAVEFCDRLSRFTGKSYRLPSEAEWEYACRAGTTTPFHFGPTITADWVNCDGNYPFGKARKSQYRDQTIDVGTFPPNSFGLYDMHGNVWEWCADPWHDNYQGVPSDGSIWTSNGNESRVVRGGSWYVNPVFCRAPNRKYNSPGDRYSNLGFRVVCSVVPGLF